MDSSARTTINTRVKNFAFKLTSADIQSQLLNEGEMFLGICIHITLILQTSDIVRWTYGNVRI